MDDNGKVNGIEMIYKSPALLFLQLYKVHWEITDRTLPDHIIDIASPCRGSKSFEREIGDAFDNQRRISIYMREMWWEFSQEILRT